MKVLVSRLADKSGRGYRGTSHTLVRSYIVGDMAVTEWSDGSTNHSPSKTTTPDRKRQMPLSEDLGFRW